MNIRKTCLLTLVGVLASAVSFGATYTVTSAADSGDGTLRALLVSVDADDVIEIPAGMTITLASKLTLPKKNVTIRGNGLTSIISGNDAVQLLEINYGSAVRYVLDNLVLERGYSAAQTVAKVYDGSAGIVLTQPANATLVMTDCTVRNMSVNPVGTTFERGVFMHGGANTFDFYATNTVFTGLWGGCVVMTVGNNYGISSRNFVLSKCKIKNNGDTLSHPCASLLDIAPAEGGMALIDKCEITGNVSSNNVNAAAVANCGSNKVGTRGYLFRDCVITNNATVFGNGTFNIGFGRHRFENCNISDNVAFSCGLLYSSNTATPSLCYGFEFINCLIERNRSLTTTDQWTDAGLFVIRQVPSVEYQEVALISNCVIRSNYSSAQKFMYTYGSGGIMHYVDTEIADNIVRGPILIRNSDAKTNVFERCAILRNITDPEYTTAGGNGAIFTNKGRSDFFNCLIADNAMNTRYVIADQVTLVGCTIASNLCVASFGAVIPYAGSEIVDTVALGTASIADRSTALYDIYDCRNKPAVTNCYFERANNVASAVGTGIVTGKTISDLKLNWELSTEGSQTVFLDGSKMPAMTFEKDSVLRNTGVKHPLLGTLDLIRGKRRANKKADIGCWEYPEPDGLMILYQ